MKTQPRTDLAEESGSFCRLSEKEGYTISEETNGHVRVARVKILSPSAAEKTGKPVGTYVTVTPEDGQSDRNAAHVTARELAALLPGNVGSVLVVGLGNRGLTADAFGPLVCDALCVTRHLYKSAGKTAMTAGVGCVSALVPGVLAQTGVESADTVRGVVEKTDPDAVILLDALAARDIKRLCRTVQLSDTGLSPGSGVGNTRLPLTAAALGRPVLSVGVPTVVDALTLCRDLAGETVKPTDEARSLVVTPQDIDVQVKRAARLVANALNEALHPHVSEADRALLFCKDC